MTPSTLNEFTSYIKEWAPAIIEAHPGSRDILEGQVRVFNGLAASLSSSSATIHNTGRAYRSLVLLRALFCASFLASTATIRDVVRQAALIIVPRCLHVAIPGLLEEDGVVQVPSKSSISRAMLALEVSLFVRTRRESVDCIRFGWADSSDKGGYELLLSAHDEMKRSGLSDS
jgi:hypothetical protein